jgi:predicted ATP-grasp superfamily ATP-dependent carboligase
MPTSPAADRPRAIVLGTEHPRSAAVIRSLARAGIPVDVCDHLTPTTVLWRHSRLIRSRVQLSPDADTAMEELAALGAREGGVVIPTNDHYLIAVSQHHECLSRSFTLTVPAWGILEPLLDKVRFRQMALDCGLNAPLQFCPEGVSDLDRLEEELDFSAHDYVLKARRWDIGSAAPNSTRRVAKAGRTAEDVSRACREYFDRTGDMPIIEEVVPGGAEQCIGVSMIISADHAPLLAHCIQRKKLQLYAETSDFRHPYELGANAYCENTDDAEAREAAAKLARTSRYRGAVTFEFKRSTVNGKLYVLKADPRFVRATALSIALGHDQPLVLYEEHLGSNRPRPAPVPAKSGAGWIWLEAYLFSAWANRDGISLLREALRLAGRLPRIRAFAYLTWRDPLPALVLLARTAKRIIRPGQTT